eukprot:2550118-Rhodomonas_salina.2
MALPALILNNSGVSYTSKNIAPGGLLRTTIGNIGGTEDGTDNVRIAASVAMMTYAGSILTRQDSCTACPDKRRAVQHRDRCPKVTGQLHAGCDRRRHHSYLLRRLATLEIIPAPSVREARRRSYQRCRLLNHR